MFGSNVQPKRRVRQKHAKWMCCCADIVHPGWRKKCEKCGESRPDQGV